MARLLPMHAPKPAWPPFVIAALLLTLTAGSLTGAFDLYTLRVALKALPPDHARAHGLSQVLGLFGLFTMGLSLHLGPRFFGVEPPATRLARALQWLAIGGVVALVYGRLGRLLPLSAPIGFLGATLWLSAIGLWAWFFARVWRTSPLAEKDVLHRFLAFGLFWWAVSAVTLWVWHGGQVFFGTSVIPLEAVWAPALYGGTASWLWGIAFRAGLCVLQVKPASPSTLKVFLGLWQMASLGLWVAATGLFEWVEPLASVFFVAAVACGFVALKPFSGPTRSLQARALKAGMWAMGLCGALHVWSVLAHFGLWAPSLLKDAARHAFTLGGVTLMLFGFAGRMVPAFSGQTLRWPKVYGVGLGALIAGAWLRMAELLPWRLTVSMAGLSGGLAFVGIACVAMCLWPKPSASQPVGTRRRVTT